MKRFYLKIKRFKRRVLKKQHTRLCRAENGREIRFMKAKMA